MAKPKNAALGANPLSQGIFSKTAQDQDQDTQVVGLPPEPDAAGKMQETIFLNPDDRDREAVTLRLPVELNDWLDELLKQGKRKHGRKIPKELWVQAALELLKAAPVDWTTVGSEDELRETLKKLYSSFKNLQS